MTDQKDPLKSQKYNPYIARMRKIMRLPLEQVKKLSPKKLAIYQDAMSWQRSQAAEAEKATAKAKIMEPTESVAQEQQSSAPSSPSYAPPPREKPKSAFGKMARFLWTPQLNISVRGFSYSLSLLTQMLAQILVSSELLPSNHPALTQIGAQAYNVANLLREARQNVPPLRTLLKQGTPEIARKYCIIISCYGVVVSGAIGILVSIAQLLFGTARAFAQSATPGPLNGTSIGAFNYTPAPGNDMGSAIIDFIFGTGASGSTTSLVGAGLGAMLGFYSTMALTFAGIIVLWIIISAVAETARTGVPFGKQFNHIWAPIRLVVALGLLVPLGSGLNSGQYIGLYVTKWGSQQATKLWSMYADKMIATTGAGAPTQSGSGVASVQFDQNANQIMARNLFKVLLCQQIYNQYIQTLPNSGTNPPPLPINPVAKTVGTAPTGSNVYAAGTAPTVDFGSLTGVNATQPQQVTWQNANVNCGSLNGQTFGATPHDPAGDAIQAAIIGQNQAVANFVTSAGSLAQSVATSAVSDFENGTMGNATSGALASRTYANQDYQNFQTLVKAYADANNINWSQNILPAYNTNLQNMMSAHAKDYGWLGAPIWIMTVSDQNGKLVDQSQSLPTVTPPQLNAIREGTPQSIWNYASSYVDNMEPGNVSAITPETQANAFSIKNALVQMTSSVGSNPMSKFSAAGRLMLTYGFRLITPVNELKCFENPFSNPTQCAQDLKEGYLAVDSSTKGANTVWQGMTKGDIDRAIATRNSGNYGSTLGFNNGATITPSAEGQLSALGKLDALSNDPQLRAMLFPLGMIMISFGFMAILLILIPFARFALGVLQWLMQIFEMVLAMPLFALSLLKTDGEGFLPQQAQTNVWMTVGVVLRPLLMVLGIAISLIAFNSIMTIVNMIFAQSVANLDPSGNDKSYISLGVYMIFYGTLAYTLANSAFKAIDLLPNYVMSWIGARMESRVDDAQSVQQQAQGYMQTMTYSTRMGSSMESRAWKSGGGASMAGDTGGGTGGAASATTTQAQRDQATANYEAAMGNRTQQAGGQQGGNTPPAPGGKGKAV